MLASPFQIVARKLPRDDLLFVQLATSIFEGRWLGDFSSLTLTKAPGYSLWLALERLLHLPPIVTEHLIFIASAGILLYVLIRLGFTPLLSACACGILIFSPDAFSIDQMRLSRVFFYDALTLLSMSLCLLSLCLRDWRALLAVTVINSAVLALHSLTREEFIWMAPPYAVFVLGFFLLQKRRATPRPITRTLLVIFLPLAAVAAADLSVRAINLHYYGVAIVHDQRDGNFPKAMGALARIATKEERRFVPISREARRIAYQVSPAFAGLEQRLEHGQSKESAQKESCLAVQVCTDMTTGWVYWALRDVVRDVGYYKDAASAEAFYGRVAWEINDACEKKTIACGSPHASLLPVFRSWLVPHWLNSLGRGKSALMRPEFLTTAALGRKDWWLAKDKDTVKPQFQGLFPDATIYQGSNASSEDLARIQYAAVVQTLWPWVIRLSLALGAFYAGWVSVRFLRTRQLEETHLLLLIAMGICLTGVASRIGVLAVIDATGFPAFGHYFLPAYALMAAYATLAAAIAFEWGRQRRLQTPAPDVNL